MVALMVALGATSFGSQPVPMVLIEYPGAVNTRPMGINNRGDVVGVYVNPDSRIHGFLLDHKGEFTSIDVPAAIQTNAQRINSEGDMPGALGTGIQNSAGGSNNKGEIVGGYLWTDMKLRGFLKDADGFHTIDFPDTMLINPKSINERGDIVGFYRDLGNRDHGFLIRR